MTMILFIKDFQCQCQLIELFYELKTEIKPTTCTAVVTHQ